MKLRWNENVRRDHHIIMSLHSIAIIWANATHIDTNSFICHRIFTYVARASGLSLDCVTTTTVMWTDATMVTFRRPECSICICIILYYNTYFIILMVRIKTVRYLWLQLRCGERQRILREGLYYLHEELFSPPRTFATWCGGLHCMAA